MSRFRLILVGVALAVLFALSGSWWQSPTTLPEIPVQRVTRGPAPQETPEQIALADAMKRLSHETPLPLTWLQAGVTFNGEIPLWGLITGLVLGVAAFAALKMQMSAHEKADDDRFITTEHRFTSNDEMLAEIRGDIKTLLARHALPTRHD